MTNVTSEPLSKICTSHLSPYSGFNGFTYMYVYTMARWGGERMHVIMRLSQNSEFANMYADFI
jgi:hypothetical protein